MKGFPRFPSELLSPDETNRAPANSVSALRIAGGRSTAKANVGEIVAAASRGGKNADVVIVVVVVIIGIVVDIEVDIIIIIIISVEVDAE